MFITLTPDVNVINIDIFVIHLFQQHLVLLGTSSNEPITELQNTIKNDVKRFYECL